MIRYFYSVWNDHFNNSCYSLCLHTLCVRLFATPWTVAHQAPLSMGKDSPGKNNGVGCHALFQGIFPAQGLNPGPSHCRKMVYRLSHQGNPRILERVAYSFFRGASWPRSWTRVSCMAGRFFTSWATQEALVTVVTIKVVTVLKSVLPLCRIHSPDVFVL